MNPLDRNKINGHQVFLIVTASNWTTTRAVGFVYQLANTWRLNFNITGSFSSGTDNIFSLTVQGITTFSVDQSVSIFDGNIQSRSSDQNANGYWSSGSSLRGIFSSSISIANTWSFTGDVELASKPSFVE